MLSRLPAGALALTVALALPALAGPPADAVAEPAPLPPRGTVTAAEPLQHANWVPQTTRAAHRLTYVSLDARGEPALSTGAVFLPHGTPPEGGWPVVSWAHGTKGLGDTCAPSQHPLSDRDATYLGTWMREGYAVVASDYAGLGTPGVMAYLDGRSTAANVVDMVTAAHEHTEGLGADDQLSDRWVVIGQSQGAAGAIQAARYATSMGGPGLDYRGAVATGTPAYVEQLVRHIGPLKPPVPLPPPVNAYVIYILAGFRSAHPELGIDDILTPAGRTWLARAEEECLETFAVDTALVSIGSFFTRDLGSLPGFWPALQGYLAMPETGFDAPFFLGHGLLDTQVPLATTLVYAQTLQNERQPVTFKVYPTTHSGTMAASLKDTLPYVRALLADQ